MKIKTEVIEKVRQSIILRTELMKLFNCSEFTLLKMLRTNDRRLTQADALFIISNKLNVVSTDLMEEKS